MAHRPVVHTLLAALAIAIALPAWAQKQELKFSFSGADAGTNVFERKDDGSFESTTKLALSGITIESRLTGKIESGKLIAFDLEQSRAGTSVKIHVEGGKAQIEAGGQKIERPFSAASVVFANFHPGLSASLARAFTDTASGSQRVQTFVLDGGVSIPVDLVKRPAKTIEVDGARQVVAVFRARFSSVDMDLFVADGERVVGWDVPAQLLKAIAPGFDDLVVDPTTKMPELSQPTHRVTVEKGVAIPMRDGVALQADIARPEGNGKFPVILARTPYGRGSQMATAEWWARRGYVFVAQDVRGRGDSGGAWTPFVHERKDGYDTIDWLSKRPWSSGAVGMIGGSYVAWVQWWAAVERHPALKCLIPQVSPPDPFFNMPIDHGIPFIYGGVWWAGVVKDKGPLTGLPALKNLDALKILPITKIDDAALGNNVPYVDAWWKKETPAAFGPVNFERDLKSVTIPALHISGWWDGDGIGTKRNWAAMRALGRKNQWLLYGPWTHAFNTTSRLGDTDYGPDAILELESLYLRWFDTWLKGKQVGLAKTPRVRVFVTGANRWQSLSDWPDARSTKKTLYLGATAPANGPGSAGALTQTAPPRGQKPDRYTYNPAHAPIPKELGNTDPGAASTKVTLEPRDQDTLLYKTAPLAAPIAMGGPIEVELFIATSAVDTDFYASVVDIDAKGEIRAIGRSGKIRAKYHAGFDKPQLLTPGKIYKLTLAHWDVAHEFKAGHRIGLLITSNGFPLFARNLGTGEPSATGTRMVTQRQTIYHDALRPSALRFRELPR